MMRLFAATLATAVTIFSAASMAQDAYPRRPITILVPAAAGEVADAAEVADAGEALDEPAAALSSARVVDTRATVDASARMPEIRLTHAYFRIAIMLSASASVAACDTARMRV